MYSVQAPSRPVHRQFPGGPPLAGLAVTTTRLFLADLIIRTARAGGMIPSPPGSGVTTLAFFHDHQDAVTVSSFFQFAASVQMAIYAETVSSRLHVRLQDGRAETVWS